jgi:hypothetical protein
MSRLPGHIFAHLELLDQSIDQIVNTARRIHGIRFNPFPDPLKLNCDFLVRHSSSTSLQRYCTFKSVMAAGALKGTVTELLTADTSGGFAVSCVTATNECPEITLAEHVPVAVVGGIVVGQGTTVPGVLGTGTLVS